MVNIKEIAQKANVSIGTVDRVIHNRGRVAKTTEEKIRRLVDELGYKPNILARNLKLAKIFAFGIVIPQGDQEKIFEKFFITGIRQAIKEFSGYHIHIQYYPFEKNNKESIQTISKEIAASKLDGLLLAPVLKDHFSDLINQLPEDLPYLFFNADIPSAAPICRISQDEFRSGSLAAKLMHLMIQTTGNILIIIQSPHDMQVKSRLEGFLSYIKEKTILRPIVYEMNHDLSRSMDEIFFKDTIQKHHLKGLYFPEIIDHHYIKFIQPFKKNTGIRIVGHGCTAENLSLLNEEFIDFLINQMPETQGYQGMYTLFRHVALEEQIPSVIDIKLEIITKENVSEFFVDPVIRNNREAKSIEDVTIYLKNLQKNPLPESVKKDIHTFQEQTLSAMKNMFTADNHVFLTRAPARLDIMGGIADYSGSEVLEGTLNEATIVGIQKRNDNLIVIQTCGLDELGWKTHISVPMDTLFIDNKVKSKQHLYETWSQNPKQRWASYVLGAFGILLNESPGFKITHGCSVGIHSNIPIGYGLGSSAAIEVAALMAICRFYDLFIEPDKIPRICQKIENEIVGAPCGIMDQMISFYGETNKLLALKCQPQTIQNRLESPQGIQFMGINSGIRHSVGESAYINARVATFMGRKIIFDHARKKENPNPFQGYLCNVTPDEWYGKYSSLVPEKILGRTFIHDFKSHEDPVTQIRKDHTYFPSACTEHAILENARVNRFIAIIHELKNGLSENLLIEAGELMFESHESYSNNCNLGSEETDILVNLVRSKGPGKGLYGAKITGGGSGGTVAILALSDTNTHIQEIIETYQMQTGIQSQILYGSSPGAVRTGIIEYAPKDENTFGLL